MGCPWGDTFESVCEELILDKAVGTHICGGGRWGRVSHEIHNGQDAEIEK